MEFDDVAREVRKIFAHYKMLGCSLNIMHTLKTFDIKRMKYEGRTECEEEVKIPIPFKLMGFNDALENIFAWITPQNLFDENNKPRTKEKRKAEPCIGRIECICDKFANLFLARNIDNT